MVDQSISYYFAEAGTVTRTVRGIDTVEWWVDDYNNIGLGTVEQPAMSDATAEVHVL